MKASEMTNDELADYIVNVIGGGIFKEYYAEAAARLRNQGNIIKMAHVETRIAAGLRRHLKVAEDALVKLKTICEQTEYSYGRSICDEALAVICAEGTTN